MTASEKALLDVVRIVGNQRDLLQTVAPPPGCAAQPPQPARRYRLSDAHKALVEPQAKARQESRAGTLAAPNGRRAP